MSRDHVIYQNFITQLYIPMCHSCMSHDHVIYQNFIAQLSRRLYPPNLVGIHIRMRWYNIFMSLR